MAVLNINIGSGAGDGAGSDYSDGSGSNYGEGAGYGYGDGSGNRDYDKNKHFIIPLNHDVKKSVYPSYSLNKNDISNLILFLKESLEFLND